MGVIASVKPSIVSAFGSSGSLPNCCRAHWRFDHAGDIMDDVSGATNKATNSGSTQVGAWRYFDGSDDYLSVPNTPALDVTSAPLAVFATCNLTAATSGMMFCKNVTAAADIQYALFWNSSTLAAHFYAEGASVCNSGASTVPAATKVNIGFIWQNGVAQTYVNGKKYGASAALSSALTSRANVRIGRRETAGNMMKGYMYNVSVYAGSNFNVNDILNHQREVAAEAGCAV